MSYKQTINKLFDLQKFGMKFGLSSTENLLKRLGDPHRELKILHLAGTNGKGSVGATITTILERGGYKVGFYTSPHLVTFRERFLVGGEMIEREDVARLADRVWSVCVPEEPPTFFEFITVMAFLYFLEKGVDLAVMETGLGGRLDATNVARPLVGVITNISLEHTEHLGPTLAHIAREKAGIIKPGLPVVTGEKRPALRKIFAEITGEKKGRLYVKGVDFKHRSKPAGGFHYHGLNRTLDNLSLKLSGAHQIGNASLALAALELLEERGLAVGEADIRSGLLDVNWPGRAEIISRRPDIMLDGAHNPGAAKALASLLGTLSYPCLHMVLGVMADKDIEGIMSPLLPKAQRLYLTRTEYSRGADPAALARFIRSFGGAVTSHPSIAEAIAAAREQAGPDDLILITGSLFTVGEARAHLTGTSEG